jgi:magnesium transporter
MPYVISAETKIYPQRHARPFAQADLKLVETQRDMLTGLIEMHLSLSAGAHQRRSSAYLTIVSVDLHAAHLPGRYMGHEFRSCESSPWNMPELKSPITAIPYRCWLHGRCRNLAG